MKSDRVLIGFGYWGKKVASSSKKHVIKIDPHVPGCKMELKIIQNMDNPKVWIATPPKTQYEVINLVLAANSTATILVEKPVMLGDHRFTEDFARTHNDKIIAGHTFLQEDGFISTIKTIEKLKDRPVYIQGIRYNTAGPCRSDYSNLQDYGIHDLYLFYEICHQVYGDVDVRDVQFYNIRSTKLSGHFEISYKNIHGSFKTSAVSERKERRWIINSDNFSTTWDYAISKNISKTPLEIQWDLLDGKFNGTYYHTLMDAYKCGQILKYNSFV